VVAELAMSKIEDKVYELTAPTMEGRSAREAIVGSARQELWLKAEGVDLAASVNDEDQTAQAESWTADPGMTKEPEGLLGRAPNLNNQELGSILDHAFGPKIDRLRERNRILSDRNRPILSRRS
jgi:hypothetical protein